jgi:hypothetical protein
MTLIHGTLAFSSPLVPQSGHRRMASPATGICSLGNQKAGFYLGKGGLDSHLPHGKNRDTTLADKRPTLGRQQRAEPKEASMEPAYHAYHAYHAHFCDFPRSPALRKPSATSGTPEERRKIAARGLNTLNTHFFAISREAPEGLTASTGQRNAEKSRQRKPRAHRAHTLAISRTRISCHDALKRTTCAPFRRERHMKFTEATKFHRKYGENPPAP